MEFWDEKYCYPDTNVLKNKYNVTELEKLKKIERLNSSARCGELEASYKNSLDKYKINFEELQAIHKYMFKDIYTWAGQIRDVNISKGMFFCEANLVKSYADSVFEHIDANNGFKGVDKETFCEKMGNLYSDINAMHPFREGNGRATRTFLKLTALKSGYELSFSKVNSEQIIQASIDGMRGDNRRLIQVIKTCIVEEKEKNIDKSTNIKQAINGKDFNSLLNDKGNIKIDKTLEKSNHKKKELKVQNKDDIER